MPCGNADFGSAKVAIINHGLSKYVHSDLIAHIPLVYTSLVNTRRRVRDKPQKGRPATVSYAVHSFYQRQGGDVAIGYYSLIAVMRCHFGASQNVIRSQQSPPPSQVSLYT